MRKREWEPVQCCRRGKRAGSDEKYVLKNCPSQCWSYLIVAAKSSLYNRVGFRLTVSVVLNPFGRPQLFLFNLVQRHCGLTVVHWRNYCDTKTRTGACFIYPPQPVVNVGSFMTYQGYSLNSHKSAQTVLKRVIL